MNSGKKIRVVQFGPKPCAPLENAARMADMVRRAKADGAGLVLFPYASVADDGDAMGAGSEIALDLDAAKHAVVAASDGIGVLFAVPGNKGPLVFAENGKVVSEGQLLHCVHAANLGCRVSAVSRSGWDAWDEIKSGEAEVVAIAADDRFSRDWDDGSMAADLSLRVGAAVCYANRVGVADVGKSVWTYIGDSAVYERGRKVAVAKRFDEDFIDYDLAAGTAAPPTCAAHPPIAEVLRFGLRKFMEKAGVRRIVIGVSGGIDSAVSSALYGSIMDPGDILLVSMPGPFTSATTRGLAHSLARNIGARFAEIPIGEGVELTKRQFAELVTEGPHGAMAGAWSLSSSVVENVQARDRSSRILAAAAAAFGGVFTCNANKDECTIGYGTMYGDIAGWLCCLGDLWKGDVYAVGRYLNEKHYGREVIPEGIFNVRPSAELSEKQAVEKGLGDPLFYPYHDKLFKKWVEGGATPTDCLEVYASGRLAEFIGYDGDINAIFPAAADFVADIERWWGMYRGLAVAKRMQAPPILAVSNHPFSEEVASQGQAYFSARYRKIRAAFAPL